MKISELAAQTGQSVATLKFYLRLGVLAPGESLSRTRAEYGPQHVERVRLVRALTGVGGLDLATVARILQVVDDPDAGRLDLLREGQDALIPAARADAAARDRALAWLRVRGWNVHPAAPAVDEFALAWEACDAADLGVEEDMDAYADAMAQVARVDVASVPRDPAAALRQVVLGTVLVDPLLAALRRLAQQHLAREREGAPVVLDEPGTPS